MTLKVWTIEVRVDFDEKSKEALMLRDVMHKAKELITTAQLLADKRKPDIAVHSDDMFLGREQVELFDGEELSENGC